MSFVASGLPQEANWTVSFNDQIKSSTSNTIIFEIQNGEYSFSIFSPSGYNASLSSGTVIVNSENFSQQILFNSTVQDSSLFDTLFPVVVVLILIAIVGVVIYLRKH